MCNSQKYGSHVLNDAFEKPTKLNIFSRCTCGLWRSDWETVCLKNISVIQSNLIWIHTTWCGQTYLYKTKQSHIYGYIQDQKRDDRNGCKIPCPALAFLSLFEKVYFFGGIQWPFIDHYTHLYEILRHRLSSIHVYFFTACSVI